MAIIQINEGQTLKDIAAEHLGSIALMYELAVLNGIEITADLVAGETLIIPDVEPDKISLVKEFSNKKISPASALESLVLNPLDWDVFYGLFD
jgi:hypothetical protein